MIALVEYVRELFESIKIACEKRDRKIIFVKHYNTFGVSKENIDECKKEEDSIVLYHQFHSREMHSAYEPFLDWLRVLYGTVKDELSIEELFEQCNVYQLHRPVFASFFRIGKCVRPDLIIYNEIEYERERIKKEILDMMIFFIKRKKVVMILDRIHLSDQSTMDVFEQLITMNELPIQLLVSYNELYSIQPVMMEQWERIQMELDHQNAIVDWGIETKILGEKSTGTFEFKVEDIEEYLLKIHNMVNTLALSEARYYLETIYMKCEVERVKITTDHFFELLMLFAETSIYNKNMSNAILLCETMKEMVVKEKNPEMEFSYLYLACSAHLYNSQEEVALQYCNQAKKLAQKIGKEYFVFLADLMIHMIEYYGWCNIWLCNYQKEPTKQLKDRCIRYGFLNHLSHMYVYGYQNDTSLYSTVTGIDTRLVHYEKGIKIAKQLDNEFFLLEAYQRNVMISSSNGYFDVANYYYNHKCKPIVLKHKNKVEEAHIYLGIGYNSCAMEKFERANAYFNQALDIYIKEKNLLYAGEAIYNMAINAILAQQYQFADKCMMYCLKIIDVLKVESIRVCHISKIYALRAFCNFKLGIYYSSQNYLKSAHQFLEHILLDEADQEAYVYWDDDLFLYHLVCGMNQGLQKKYEEANHSFDQAFIHNEAYKGGAFFNYCIYVEERAHVYEQMGEHKKAKELRRQGIEYCGKQGYYYKKRRLELQEYGVNIDEFKGKIGLKNYSFYQLEQIIRNYGLRKDYLQQKEEMEFFNVWQRMINDSENMLSTQKLINSAMFNLKNEFSLEHFIFVRIEDKKPVVRYNDSAIELTPEKINEFLDYFNHNTTEFIISKLNKNYHDYDEVFQLLESNNLSSVLGIPVFINGKLNCFFVAYMEIRKKWGSNLSKFAIDKNELLIYKYLLRQLMDAIEKTEALIQIEHMNRQLQEANKKLMEYSITDMLTGLYNRHGFKEHMMNDIKKARGRNRSLKLAILYLDLDNFKYYNDTFGHNVGDYLLIEFTRLMKQVIGTKGYGVRYGGDEFLIILHEADEIMAEQTATAIYEQLRRKNYFIEEISKRLNQVVQIQKKNRFSCSIGISLVDGEANYETIIDTIKRADEVLYDIKKSGKGRFKIKLKL